MIEICLGNSFSSIKGMVPPLDKILWETLRFRNPNTFNGSWKKRDSQYIYVSSYKDGVFYFPTGLLKIIQRFFYNRNLPFQIYDNRPLPPSPKVIPFTVTPPTLRPYQQHCLDLFNTHSRGTICLPTGLGKTLLCIYLIKQLGQRTIFIVPSLNLKIQTMNEFLRFFPKNMVSDALGKTIFVINYQALANKPVEYFRDYNTLIIDEAHHTSCDTIYELNRTHWNHIYYRIFVSATPYRNDGTDMKLHAVIGDTLFNYPIPQAIKDGWIVKPFFFIFKMGTVLTQSFQSYHEEYRAGIVENEERNAKIIEVADKMQKGGRHTLILVKHIEHGERLQKGLLALGIDVKFIKGETSNEGQRFNRDALDDFRSKGFPILIGTSVIGEGVDVKSIDTIINAGGGKAKSDIIQKIGRSLRILAGKNNAYIIDFLDHSTPTLNKHSLERIEHFKIYKSEIHIM